MELTYELVRFGKLVIIGETGIYPETNNCYKVEVIEREGKKDEKKWVCHYCPKPVYDMWVRLKNVVRLIGAGSTMGIIDVFNEYGEWKWRDADYNASMNQSEDI